MIDGRLKIFIPARMAELVDAHGSGSCVRKDVLVQLQSRALLWGGTLAVISAEKPVFSFQTPLLHGSQNLLSRSRLLQNGRYLHP